MTDNVARLVSVPQPASNPVVQSAAPPAAAPSARNDNLDTGRYRLSIEALGPNRFVYKVLDRVTGEVIRQLPREDVAKLNGDPTYRGGTLIDTVV